LGNADKR